MRLAVQLIAALVAATAVSLTACQREPQTIARLQVTSPDKVWVALARTDQWAGPGNNALHETVSLKQAIADRDSVDVFDLDEQIATPPIDIQLVWLNAHVLAIEYSQPAEVAFHAVRMANVEIVACGPSTPPNPLCPPHSP